MPPWLIPGVQLKIGMHTNLCDPLLFYVPPQNNILQFLLRFMVQLNASHMPGSDSIAIETEQVGSANYSL